MRVYVNGKEQSAEPDTRLQTLLETLELSGRYAVEVNAEVIRRSLHASHVLREGDRVEVVTFVGGG